MEDNPKQDVTRASACSATAPATTTTQTTTTATQDAMDVADVAETVARCFPDASTRFSFLLALGSREIRDTILLNEYTYRGASFSVGRKSDGSLPPRHLLEAAGRIHVHGNTFRLTALDRRAFGHLASLSLTGVHVSASDVRSIAQLQLRELCVRDSQLDVSIHEVISMFEESVRSLELESVLCCCGMGTNLRQRIRDDNRATGPCVHTLQHLEYLGLLGNVRCARRACSCRITGGVRRVRLAKADDSVVETRGLRDLQRYRGAWSKSWMVPAMDVGAGQRMPHLSGHPSSPPPGCLQELRVEGDIDADDLLAVLVANATTLRVVRIGGEVQRMTTACCRKLVDAARAGVSIDL